MTSVVDFFEFPGSTLREATPNDIKELTGIINKAFRYQDEAKGAPRLDPGQLERKMTKAMFYVVAQEDKLIGCFYLQPEEESLHFGLLTSTDKYRGKGLGPAVMKAIERFARAEDFKDISLDYMSLSPWLKKYYEGYGFEETGEIEDIGWSKLIHMRKKL